MAMELGLLLKTTYQNDKPVTRYDLAQMIYNVFDRETFFNEGNYVFADSLGLTEISGQVTDNGITAIADKTAVGIKGNPKIVGLDIIWNLEDEGKKFKGGKILDPAKGKIYSSEAWIENGNLILRGKIGPFGRNQTWIKNNDLSLMIKDAKPNIPEKE